MRKKAITAGATLLAATGLMFSHATAVAEPEGQLVRYTITTEQEAMVGLYYLATEPASQAAYDADPDAYLRNERVSIAPGAPWVFETTLNDTSWAYVSAGAAARYSGSASPHCDIAIDEQIVVDQHGDTSVMCALKPW